VGFREDFAFFFLNLVEISMIVPLIPGFKVAKGGSLNQSELRLVKLDGEVIDALRSASKMVHC
jgi:hypothetical protein